MKKKSIAVVALCSMCVGAFAVATNTWVAGSSDWSLPGSYEENRVPGEDDCVLVPAGVEAAVKVDATESANAEGSSFDVFSKLNRVLLGSSSSRIVLDVAEGASVTNFCYIVGKTSGEGVIVKRGLGTIEFGKNDWQSGYDLDLTVEAGTLVLPQAIDTSGNGGNYLLLRKVTVNRGAVLVTAEDVVRNQALAHGYTKVNEIWGSGVITNRYSSNRLFFRTINTFEFGGDIVGGVRLFPDNAVTVLLTGENSTVTPSIGGGATLGFKKLGMKGERSSLGTAEIIFRDSGRMLYLGDGEKSNKDIKLWTNGDDVHTIDGGATGGLELAGTVSHYNEGSYGMKRLEFAGSNTVPCVFSGTLPTWNILGTNYNFHVIKSGSGTWRFSDKQRTNAGAFTVAEGTLQFDSLKERGNPCSLGTATNLTDNYGGLLKESKRVDWAFALGAENTAGVFEYTGANHVWCDSRPLVMRGNGALSVTNKNVRFRFANVSADEGVAAVLTLTGANTNESSLVNATDGKGRLSIAKEGEGKWYLEGANSFSGSLAVKEGTLIVRNPADYSWWRWTVQETYAEFSDLYAQAQEFCLYDENGCRVNGHLAQVSGLTKYENLEPGMAAYHKRGEVDGQDITKPLKNLFDDGSSDKNPGAGWVFAWYTNGVQIARPMLDKPDTWIPIVMRLTNGAARVASFDMVHLGGGTSGRNVDCFMLEGSVDGVNWSTVTNVTEAKSAGQNTWLFTRKSYTTGSADTHSGGAAIRGGPLPEDMLNPLANVSDVSVAAGAVLKAEGEVTLPALTVDANGAGTIDGFAFAQNGTLSVVNLPDMGTTTLDAVFLNCTGLDNVANWCLTVDGRISSKISAVVRNGKIAIMKKGLAVVVK